MTLEQLLAELKKYKVDTLSFRTKEDFEKALARERGIDLGKSQAWGMSSSSSSTM